MIPCPLQTAILNRSNLTELELINDLKQNVAVWHVLETAGSLGLNQWFVGAGAICQTVWNLRHGFAADKHLKDIDLIYFDRQRASADEEREKQRQVDSRFRELSLQVEAINQARVHEWYESEFGFLIPPYHSSESAIL